MNRYSSRRDELLSKLKAMGVEPKRSLGQNFLVAEHVIDKIVTAAKLTPSSAILEIGPGLGALTEGLMALGRPFRVIELDSRFAQAWRERGLEVVEADALALDWSTLALPADTLLVSNLPYQISSSLVIERSIDPAGIGKMILMFQKEVAQRLVARPATKEYGLLTVIAQSFWNVRLLLEAGPGDFYPPPNVASRVLLFSREAPQDMVAPERFLAFAKAGFAHRRKLLARNLVDGWLRGEKGKLKDIEAALAEIGKGPMARAEELDPAQFQRLYSRLQ